MWTGDGVEFQKATRTHNSDWLYLPENTQSSVHFVLQEITSKFLNNRSSGSRGAQPGEDSWLQWSIYPIYAFDWFTQTEKWSVPYGTWSFLSLHEQNNTRTQDKWQIMRLELVRHAHTRQGGGHGSWNSLAHPPCPVNATVPLCKQMLHYSATPFPLSRFYTLH